MAVLKYMKEGEPDDMTKETETEMVKLKEMLEDFKAYGEQYPQKSNETVTKGEIRESLQQIYYVVHQVEKLLDTL